MLNIGLIGHLGPDHLNIIQKQLTLRAAGKISLFEEQDLVILLHIEQYWDELISKKRIDLPEVAAKKKKRLIEADTIKHRRR